MERAAADVVLLASDGLRAQGALTANDRIELDEDLTELQAADILRCSAKALNQLVVRAMKTLRTRIGEEPS